MKKITKFLILMILASLVYIGHIVKACISGPNLQSHIMGYVCCLIWMAVFAIEHIISIKENEIKSDTLPDKNIQPDKCELPKILKEDSKNLPGKVEPNNTAKKYTEDEYVNSLLQGVDWDNF